MRSARRAPRHIRSLAVVGALAAIGWGWVGDAAPAGAAVGPAASPNLLDHARVDVALLESKTQVPFQTLLVIDPAEPGVNGVRLRILERSNTGTVASTAETTVDLGPIGAGPSDQPWLVGLGGDRFALIATEAAAKRSRIVMVSVEDASGRPVIVEHDRLDLDEVIDDAGAADVTGDGHRDLVAAAVRAARPGDTCHGSALRVFADGDLRRRETIPLPDILLAAGVLGSFDAVSGDDLAVYAYPACPARPDGATGLRLLGIRLVDGTVIADRSAGTPDARPPSVGPPVRLDAGGDGRHELLALARQGLAVVDPWDGWSAVRIGTSASYPLVAAPAGPGDGAGPGTVRIAWLEPLKDGRGSIGLEEVHRSVEGTLDPGSTAMWSPGSWQGRWDLVIAAAAAGAARQASPVGLVLPDLDDRRCHAAVVPTAAIGCQGLDPDEGPAWIGSRPLALVDEGDHRVALVASGLVMEADVGIPATPTPWAGRTDGSWRHGPSVPFALAVVDDTQLGAQTARAPTTVAPIAGVGPAAGLGGRAGLRLVVGATPMARDAPDPDPAPGIDAVIAAFGAGRSGTQVIRLVVPPGTRSAATREQATVPLVDVMVGGTQITRWAVTALPVSDVGEVGAPISASVLRDVDAPAISLTVPFTSPVFPLRANLRGATEAGAAVTIDGVGRVATSPDGTFTFQAALAPWPQTIHLVATDPAGNATVLEVSIVGGVDYRQFPWAVILVVAILAGVIVTAFMGARRDDRARASKPATAGDPDVGPELEELPPGDGL